MPFRNFFFCAQIVFCFAFVAAICGGQTLNGEAAPPIKLNAPIDGRIAASGIKTFALHLESNQSAVLILEQKNFNAALAIDDAATGKRLLEIDAHAERFGDERALFLNESAAARDVLIRVSASQNDASAGDFSLSLVELKSIEPTDKLRFAAQEAALDGLKHTAEEKKESKEQGRALLEKALKLARESGDRRSESDVLSFLQSTYNIAGDMNKALEYGNQALALLGGRENSYAYAIVKYNVGYSLVNMGEPKRGADVLSETLAKARSFGDSNLENWIRNNLSYAYLRLGESAKGIAVSEEVYAAAKADDDKLNQAIALKNLSYFYYDLGEFTRAVDLLNTALPIGKESGNTASVSNIYNELGRNATSLGQMQKALDYYRQSLAVKRQSGGSKYNEAINLGNIARTYASMGQNARALEYNRESARIFDELKYKDAAVNALFTTGTIYLALKDFERAQETLTETLKLAEENKFLVIAAQAYQSLGEVEANLNRPAAAIDDFLKAASLRREQKTSRLEAVSLNSAAGVYARLGQFEKAFEFAKSSLDIARAVGDRITESNALYNLARARRGQKDSAAALVFIEDSLKIVETLRANLLSQESRTAYFSIVRDKYDFYISLLIEMQNTAENKDFAARAFAASERARARGLLDLLAESFTDVSGGVSPELKERERQIEAKLSALQTQSIRLKSAPKLDAPRIAALQKEIEKADDDRERLESETRRTNPRYAALKYPATLDLAQTQALLDEKTVLLEYQTGADASYLFAVGKNDFQVARLPDEQTLRRSIEMLRAGVSAPTRVGLSNYLIAGRELYRSLLAPVENLLKSKTKIVVAADGALNYLPFEVLLKNDASGNFNKLPYLVRDFEISYTPSASVLANLKSAGKTAKPEKSFLAFAAPDYAPKTVAQIPVSQRTNPNENENRALNLTDLQYARTEATRIAALFPAGQSAVFTGSAATEERVKTGDFLSQYRYLHFAVHGLINEQQPQFSSLVLSLPKSENQIVTSAENPKSEDGLLQTPEIFNLRLNVDLVTLSACETGLGQSLRGEGIVGLTRAFFYAGTPSVLVSLWKVDDASTAELMTAFYEQLRKNGERDKAAALRQAQLKLIDGNRYAHPYYWAPFVLQGRSDSSFKSN